MHDDDVSRVYIAEEIRPCQCAPKGKHFSKIFGLDCGVVFSIIHLFRMLMYSPNGGPNLLYVCVASSAVFFFFFTISKY